MPSSMAFVGCRTALLSVRFGYLPLQGLVKEATVWHKTVPPGVISRILQLPLQHPYKQSVYPG